MGAEDIVERWLTRTLAADKPYVVCVPDAAGLVDGDYRLKFQDRVEDHWTVTNDTDVYQSEEKEDYVVVTHDGFDLGGTSFHSVAHSTFENVLDVFDYLVSMNTVCTDSKDDSEILGESALNTCGKLIMGLQLEPRRQKCLVWSEVPVLPSMLSTLAFERMELVHLTEIFAC